MSGVELAAIIGAATTLVLGLLGLLGAGIKYVVMMILDAYKAQVESTEEAKNAEISAKDARIDRHMTELAAKQNVIDHQANTIVAHEDTIACHEDTISDLRDRVRELEGGMA